MNRYRHNPTSFHQKATSGMIWVITVIIVVVFILIVSGSISYELDPADFARIMRQEGIESPVNNGHQWSGCSDSDTINSGFSGIKNGVGVRGVVCGGAGGWGSKAFTVRYF